MPVAEISAAVTSLNATLSIAKAMVGLRDAESFRAKSIEMQQTILDALDNGIAAREAYATQLDRIRALEAEVASLGIVKLASGMSAWITSVPGDKVITFDCLEHSPFPEEMRQCGYILQDEGDGQRILASALVEHFVRAADGQLELLTEGSTRPIAESRHHAGICRVRKWSFEL